jgi:hypothetical protein
MRVNRNFLDGSAQNPKQNFFPKCLAGAEV